MDIVGRARSEHRRGYSIHDGSLKTFHNPRLGHFSSRHHPTKNYQKSASTWAFISPDSLQGGLYLQGCIRPSLGLSVGRADRGQLRHFLHPEHRPRWSDERRSSANPSESHNYEVLSLIVTQSKVKLMRLGSLFLIISSFFIHLVLIVLGYEVGSSLLHWVLRRRNPIEVGEMNCKRIKYRGLLPPGTPAFESDSFSSHASFKR